MAGQDYRFIDAHLSRKGGIEVDEDVTLKPHQQVIYATSDGDDGAYTITLPHVSDAEGKFYSVIKDNEGQDNVTVTGETFIGTYQNVLDAVLTEEGEPDAPQSESLLLYSDGLVWHELHHEDGW